MNVRTDARPEITAEEFAWLARFLHGLTGIDLKPGKEAMVMGRLDRRLRHHGHASYTEYFRRVSDGDPLETRLMVDLLTTNETSFFREPAHFDFMDRWLADLPRNQRVRVWSAASSSGEEIWTIAMTLAERLGTDGAWEILGTDISSRVLETARRALYPVEAADRIPKHLLRKYCLRGRDEYEGYLAISPELTAHCEFRSANLINLPDDLGSFDIVFLRNVMIYFNTDTKSELVRRIETMIRPGGYLFVSHSESINGLGSSLRMVQPSVYRAVAGDG